MNVGLAWRCRSALLPRRSRARRRCAADRGCAWGRVRPALRPASRSIVAMTLNQAIVAWPPTRMVPATGPARRRDVPVGLGDLRRAAQLRQATVPTPGTISGCGGSGGDRSTSTPGLSSSSSASSPPCCCGTWRFATRVSSSRFSGSPSPGASARASASSSDFAGGRATHSRRRSSATSVRHWSGEGASASKRTSCSVPVHGNGGR